MPEIIRHCPDCGSDNSLGQLHAIAGGCPDTAGEYCPDWYCQLCGAALLIGDIPAGRRSARRPAELAGVSDRTAVRARVA